MPIKCSSTRSTASFSPLLGLTSTQSRTEKLIRRNFLHSSGFLRSPRFARAFRPCTVSVPTPSCPSVPPVNELSCKPSSLPYLLHSADARPHPLRSSPTRSRPALSATPSPSNPGVVRGWPLSYLVRPSFPRELGSAERTDFPCRSFCSDREVRPEGPCRSSSPPADD